MLGSVYNPALTGLDRQLTYAVQAAYADDLYASLLSEESEHFGMMQANAGGLWGARIDVNLVVEDPVGDWYNDTDRFSIGQTTHWQRERSIGRSFTRAIR